MASYNSCGPLTGYPSNTISRAYRLDFRIDKDITIEHKDYNTYILESIRHGEIFLSESVARSIILAKDNYFLRGGSPYISFYSEDHLRYTHSSFEKYNRMPINIISEPKKDKINKKLLLL